MKDLLIMLPLMCLLSCKNDKHEIGKNLQEHQWNVDGWLSNEKLKFSRGNNKFDWQTTFLSNNNLLLSYTDRGNETSWDRHGTEVVPGKLYVDSCYTYEVKNDVIKISSHGHGPAEDIYFYRIIPEKETGFNFEAVTEKDFK